MEINKTSIPKEIINIAEKLKKADFEAFLVGGCVRDLLRGAVHGELVEPKDWDIATNAKPAEVQKIFPDSVYENEFGTVLVKLGPRISADSDADKRGLNISENQRTNQRKSALHAVEVTTYRTEGKYTDKRHPDEIKFAKNIKDDLSRRDFTINAMAINLQSAKRKAQGADDLRFAICDLPIIDPYDGQKDLKEKVVRAVGDADERFNEDALRLMRAVRFAVEMDFKIEKKTLEAAEKRAGLLEMIAKERIRDEFAKIIMAPDAARGIILLEKLDLLKNVLPELREGIGAEQNLHHIYTVFEHHIKSLDYTVKQNYSLEMRLAALLHDLGKPKTKQGQGHNATFHGHEMVSAKMAARVLERLKFSKEIIEKVYHLVRYHMFYYNVGDVSEAGVRRFLARVGPENVDDLLKLREADRIGSGAPKAVPYKNRHLLFMIEKVKTDPISPKMLKLDGNDVMKILGIAPGPKVGQILTVLLEDVLDDPGKNIKENLEKRAKELAELSEKELANLSKEAKNRKEEFESDIDADMKKKYYVK